MTNPLNRIPLQSLRAVEAVARLGSLRAAAEDLGVTPGAVSQQVIRAEQILGRALFDRHPSGMVPSGPSAEVLQLLRRGFADLSAAVARAAPQGEDCLTVSVAPILASCLTDMQASRPTAADVVEALDALDAPAPEKSKPAS